MFVRAFNLTLRLVARGNLNLVLLHFVIFINKHERSKLLAFESENDVIRQI